MPRLASSASVNVGCDDEEEAELLLCFSQGQSMGLMQLTHETIASHPVAVVVGDRQNC